MIKRLTAFFIERGARAESPDGHHSLDEFQLAAAALLFEAAAIDGELDDGERAAITALVTARFGLSEAEADDLVAAAETKADASNQLLGFTRAIKDNFDYAERVRLIEMLWEVVYADGTLDATEDQLMRRVGGLLYVDDKDRGAARKRVRTRLGQDG